MAPLTLRFAHESSGQLGVGKRWQHNPRWQLKGVEFRQRSKAISRTSGPGLGNPNWGQHR
jgi:hypothetical protein